MTTEVQNNTTTNYSDGSELIPAEVNARAKREESEPSNKPQSDKEGAENKTEGGYTVDRMGLANNFAIEPEMYVEEK